MGGDLVRLRSSTPGESGPPDLLRLHAVRRVAGSSSPRIIERMTERFGELSTEELVALVERVFAPQAEDRGLGILVDLPREGVADRAGWRERRAMALSWWQRLRGARDGLGLDVALFWFAASGGNNADLPERAWPAVLGAEVPAAADDLDPSDSVPMAEIVSGFDLFLAPTEFSATAPLKVAAREHGFRAATMPGFSRSMVPALRLDYVEVDRRCRVLKGLLDRAERAELVFGLADGDGEGDEAGSGARCELTLDLRHRQAHASGGLLRQPGTAGNLPSGETYIVPYEGEIEGEPSRSAGRLPVQLPDADSDREADALPAPGEVVIYRVEGNRAVGVEEGGPTARREAERLAREPAYGNLAELGLGILADFRLEPIGSVLLDEKLGLHIAFGRSDHFGGIVGPSDFSSPSQVVHIDRVYLPVLQPAVTVERVDLVMDDGTTVELMRDGRYRIDFDRAP